MVLSDENMLEAVIDCTEAGATMGEIAGILRQAWGTPYDPYGYLDVAAGRTRDEFDSECRRRAGHGPA